VLTSAIDMHSNLKVDKGEEIKKKKKNEMKRRSRKTRRRSSKIHFEILSLQQKREPGIL
jgi:hypothetical protein